MKTLVKRVVIVLAMVLCMSGCGKKQSSMHSEYLNPSIGIAPIQSLQCVWGGGMEEEEPYLINFVIEFGKIVEFPEVFWVADGSADYSKAGIAIKGFEDDPGYAFLVSIDMRELMKRTGSFGTPVTIFFGVCSPVTGYPNFRSAHIELAKDVPEKERGKYFEGTPLRITIADHVYESK